MNALILAVLLTVVQATPPVQRQEAISTSGTAHANKKNATESQTPAAPSQTPINPLTSKPNQNPNNSPRPEDTPQSVRVREPPSVSVSRDWADWILWIFSGLLAAAGLLGIRLAYKTLKGIEKQTKATEDSAKATEKSVRLQEVLNRQWIDIEDMEAKESFRYGPKGRETSVVISFAVVNNTKMPLILRSVRFQIGEEQTYSRTMQHLLPPDNGYPVDFPVPLNSAELLTRYNKHELVLVVTGSAGHSDAFENIQEQAFGFTCKCGPPSYSGISPHPGLPQAWEQFHQNSN